MRIFHGFDTLPRFRHPAATVGSYDGVHCGHRLLLEAVKTAAKEQGGESVVLTFEPHPRVTLGKAEGLQLLTTYAEKCRLLADAGIENLVVIPFDEAFSHLSPDEFIRDYLIGRARIETLVVGFDHRFGRDKQGSYDYLGSHGYGLWIIEIGECDIESKKVSSTRIRHLIEAGEMSHAAILLGHPYLIIGDAKQGCIQIYDSLKLLPPPGTYSVKNNGIPAELTVNTQRNLKISGCCPDGHALITFES